MADVIYQRIAPVVTVHDLHAALARYRQLGFATEVDEPASSRIATLTSASAGRRDDMHQPRTAHF